MGKIDSIGDWNAHACLHAALEEAELGDSVFVVVIKGDSRTKYTANMTHQDLYFEAGFIQEQIMKLYREGA